MSVIACASEFPSVGTTIEKPAQTEAAATRVWMVNCHNCGFEPEDSTVPPRRCPKCGGSAFEWFFAPGQPMWIRERDPTPSPECDGVSEPEESLRR